MPFTPHGRTLDLRPSGPDVRDWKFQTPHEIAIALPAAVDLRAGFGAIVDQGALGACVGNGAAALDEYDLRLMGLLDYRPSRLLAYLNAREIEGTINSDSGASIRDGVKGLVDRGLCREELWPYDITKFSTRPPQSVYDAATKNRATAYRAVGQDLNSIKGALASGRPVIYGFAVYGSYEAVGRDGMIGPAGGALYGYHCNALGGYNDAIQRVITRNSWGTSWGDQGYGYLSYADIINPSFAFDFWVVDTVTNPEPAPTPPPPPPPPPGPGPTPPPPPVPPKKIVKTINEIITFEPKPDGTTWAPINRQTWP